MIPFTKTQNKLYFVWELLKNNLNDNGDGTFTVGFKNIGLTYFIGNSGDLKKRFPNTETTYFEICQPDVPVILMKNESYENKEGAFCREAYNKAVKENADISDFIEYTDFFKSKQEKWECVNCQKKFSKFQIGKHSHFCPSCGYFLKDENESVIRNFGLEQHWNELSNRFILHLDRLTERDLDKERIDNEELIDELFRLFVNQFEIYWKESQNRNPDLAESYDTKRREIHIEIKNFINGDLLVVQRAISHVEEKSNKKLYELLDIEDRKEAMAKIYDFSDACVKYILEEELGVSFNATNIKAKNV